MNIFHLLHIFVNLQRQPDINFLRNLSILVKNTLIFKAIDCKFWYWFLYSQKHLPPLITPDDDDNHAAAADSDDDDDELFFVVGLTDERRLALFPARDPHHHEPPPRHQEDLNLRRT